MEAEIKRQRGQPASPYATELVRDIGVQRLIAYWNENQTVLRERLRRDPDLVTPARLRLSAARFDPIVRAWLEAVDFVPRDHPEYEREVTFRFWCLRLEPPQPPQVLRANPEREAMLRKQRFFDLFETYGRPWLDAIDRVRHDRNIKLLLPVPATDDDEDWI